MKWVVLIFILLVISYVSAECEEGQVDVNSASLEELDKLQGIGEVKAQAIVDSRPFETLDDLINVYGIGEVTLENIKNQGLACVEGEEKEELVEKEIEEIPEQIPEQIIEEEEKKTEIITLSAQNIKSPENKENKSRYAIYGFVGFCVVLGILFALKKGKYKNEFR